MSATDSAADGLWQAADKDQVIDDLKAAVRARDEFVAIAAHELRNPMTPIALMVQHLKATARDPERCQPETLLPRLELLEQAVQDFLRRATTLLDASRIAAGHLQMQRSEVDFSAVVGRVADRLAIASRLARSPLQVTIQPGIVGAWDQMALEQIVENLMSNAVKFGAGRRVDVSLHADGAWATLSVRDRGIGIAQHEQARIFGRFHQAIGAREHGGFGVGLWLVQQLTHALGGTITIASEPGQGSTFTLALPLRSDPQAEGAAG